MSKPILGANSRLAKISITLPVDEDGEYAFDEVGKPVKGRTPVVLLIPRLDTLSRDQFKVLNKSLGAIDDLKDDDGEPLDEAGRLIEMVAAMIREHVTESVLALVKGLSLFEIKQIFQRIQEDSTLTVGELLASTDS